MKDYYQTLEISTTAAQEEIKSQYRLLLHAWHPDKFSTSEQKAHAEEKLKEFNEAYNVIGNPTKLKEYDRQRKYQDQDSHVSDSTAKRSKTSHNQEGSKSKSQSDIRSRKKTGSK